MIGFYSKSLKSIKEALEKIDNKLFEGGVKSILEIRCRNLVGSPELINARGTLKDIIRPLL